MPEHTRDPRADVEAPVVHALELIIARGAASFAVAVLTVLLSILAYPGHVDAVGHLALPVLLVFVALARAVHLAITRDDRVDGQGAWSRAADIDPWNARFAALVVFLVPAAWLIGGMAILARHTGTREELAAVVGVWGPLGAASWFAATLAWLGDCRERLARSLVESERRFRRYWTEVGRSA